MGVQRVVRQVDTRTGEVLADGLLVYCPVRPKVKEAFVMTFQDALKALAKDRTMTGEQWRVLSFLMSRLDFENYIYAPQTEVAKELGMKKPNVSRAVTALIQRGIIHRGPKVGSAQTMRLDPYLGWRGRVRSLEKARAARLKLVSSNAPKAS